MFLHKADPKDLRAIGIDASEANLAEIAAIYEWFHTENPKATELTIDNVADLEYKLGKYIDDHEGVIEANVDYPDAQFLLELFQNIRSPEQKIKLF